MELILRIRKDLSEQGLDVEPDTIAWHLHHHHGVTVSRATISRYLTARGLITPEPKKRPRASCIRVQAELPNQTWQADVTHYRLVDGTDAEILTWPTTTPATPCTSRAGPGSVARSSVTPFRQAVAAHGVRPPP